MAVVSRLVLNHPALGTAGGASLHAAVEALYTKIGDAISSRWFQLADFDQTETVDLEHNFDTDIENLRYDIYVFTGGQWVNLTNESSPARSAFTVIEKVGFEDNILQITNNTGGNDLLAAVVIHNDPMYLQQGDIKDVDISTTPPEEGQALVYDATTKKFKPGASGDASFKVQSVAANGTCTIKGGYLLDDAGHEYATYDGSGSASTDFGVDITFDLDSLVTSPVDNTTYNLYIDKSLLSDPVTTSDNSRELVAVTGSHFIATTSTPDSMPLERFIPIGFVRYTTGGVWSTTIFATFAFRRHQDTMVVAQPLVYEDADHSIGSVGAATVTYGELVAGSFPGAASLTSFYKLNTDGTDGSTNARTFSASGSPSFNGKGLFGRESVLQIPTTAAKLQRTGDSYFNINLASGAMTFGGWFKYSDWQALTDVGRVLMSFNPSANGILLQTGSSGLRVSNSAGSITVTIPYAYLKPIDGWLHLVGQVDAGTLRFYINGRLVGSNTGLTGTGAGSDGYIGGESGSSGLAGVMIQEAFFSTQVLTENQINQIYSKRYNGQQIAGGHVITTDSFPFASLSGKISFWNLDADANDDSVNAKHLTNNGSIPFTGLGLFGAANAATFDGSTQYFSRSDAYFDVDTTRMPFFMGGWFSLANWAPGSDNVLFGIGTTNSLNVLVTGAGNIRSQSVGNFNAPATPLAHGSWHHVMLVSDGVTHHLYLDGIKLASTLASAYVSGATTGSIATIGRFSFTGSNFLSGKASNVVYGTGVLLTDEDVLKLASAKIDLPSTVLVAKNDQNWKANTLSEDGYVLSESSDNFLVDKTATKAWVNFGGESGNRVNLRLYDGGLGATTVPVRKFDRKYTSTPPTTIAHSLPAQPTNIVILYNENADGKYREIGADAGVKSDGTNIYVDLSAYTIDATHDVRIVASIGTPFVAADSVVQTGLEDNGTLNMVKVSYLDPVDGAPSSTQFRSAITRRAKMVDLTRDLLPRIGIDRFLTQEIELVEGETASQERVFKPVNDKFEQIRFMGEWSNLKDAFGQRIYGNSASGSLKIEVQWVGTGLNVLLGVDNSTSRDLRVSIDGGAEGGNIFPASMSGVIHNRNYSPNPVVSVASGLSYGLHTAVFRVAGADMYFYGFEFLNESTSIKTSPGTALLGGLKKTLAALDSTAYNTGFESGTLGTRGGRAVIYMRKDGTIGKALTPTQSSQLNLASADHTNEEVIRVLHTREFGAGRTDDFSRLTVSTDVAFTIDDGSTSLIGNSGISRQSMNGGLTEGFLLASSGVFNVLNFIGTGLDVEFGWVSVTNTVEVFVDGISVGNLDTSDAAGTFRLKKIVSGLPYGSHTVKFIRNTAGSDGPVFKNYVVYGPKKPSIPAGAIELGEYFILGDFDATGVTATTGASHALQIPKGVISKAVARENLFVGSWSASLDHTGNRHGWIMFSSTIGNTIEYTFMGTGIVVNVDPTGSSRQFNFKIDGVNQSSATLITAGTITNDGSGNYTVSASNGGKLYVSGLAYGKHTVLLTLNSAVNFYPSFDVITPVHAAKNNGPMIIQQVMSIGSCAVSDLRYFGEKLFKIGRVSRQFPVAGINTSSTSEVANGMGTPIYLDEDSYVTCSFKMSISNNTGGQNSNVTLRLDGRLLEHFNMQLTSSSNTPVHLERTIFMRKGYHWLHIGWHTAAGILTMPNLASGGTEYGSVEMRKVS